MKINLLFDDKEKVEKNCDSMEMSLMNDKLRKIKIKHLIFYASSYIPN
jgi:hypothetical protein